MDNTAEWIPEELASEYAKVSASTLARFAEAGYFASSLIEQRRCYPKKALQSVFGVEFPTSRFPAPAAAENIVPFPHTVIASSVESETQEHASTTDTNQSTAAETPAIETLLENAAPVTSGAITDSFVKNEHTAPQADTGEPSSQFKSILAMHADILERQEREIQELRNERDWLRRRIEKYEEKAERDQVLILSSSQAVKQLIDAQGPGKSVIRQALEWLGVLPEEQSKLGSVAITHATASNSSDEKTT